jgi:hypothetical protein
MTFFHSHCEVANNLLPLEHIPCRQTVRNICSVEVISTALWQNTLRQNDQ